MSGGRLFPPRTVRLGRITFGHHPVQRDVLQLPSRWVEVERRVQMSAAVFGRREALRDVFAVRARSRMHVEHVEPFRRVPACHSGPVTVTQVDYGAGCTVRLQECGRSQRH